MARRPTKTGRMRGYVEHGSDGHAALIGLKPASDDDAYVREDGQGRRWALEDITSFGPQVTEAYIREVLRQKVSALTSPMPEVQSEDPFAPGYAPPMIVPRFGAADEAGA